jgi:hypothetical protein
MYAYPNRQDLITCFLKTNYAGHTAIVFCDVLGDCSRPARLQKLFDLADMASIINSEVFIVTGQTVQFFSLTIKEEIYGFAMFWDGMKIVSENS